MAGLSQVKTHHSESTMITKPPTYSAGNYITSEITSSDPYRHNTTQSHPIHEDFSQVRRQGSSDLYYGGGSAVQQPQQQQQPIASMKIVAPKPEHTMAKGMFPQPSPAACGKRKIMEMDAAHMLAGVAALSGIGGDSRIRTSDRGGHSTSIVKDRPPSYSVGGGLSSSNSTNNRVSIVEDNISSVPPSNVARKDVVTANTVEKPTTGFNLQIVNPESFGVSTSNNIAKTKRFGQASPLTPWDGQLETLASEVKGKEKETQRNEDIRILCNELNANREVAGAGDEGAHAITHPLGKQITRTALHEAVCQGSLQEVKRMLDYPQSMVEATIQGDGGGGGIEQLRRNQVCRVDSAGFSPLHSAASLRIVDDAGNMAVSMTHLLLSADADVDSLDPFDNTPLHWAARVGNSEVAQMLILKSCPLDLKNRMGETALHWAMRGGIIGMKTVRVLLENGARSSLFNEEHKQAIDIGTDGFKSVDQNMAKARRPTSLVEKVGSGKPNGVGSEKVEPLDESMERIKEKRQVRANLLCYSSQMRTLVLHHPDCKLHVPKSETDWESPDRIDSVMDLILQNEDTDEAVVRDYEVQVSTDFERASLELLSRVHSAEYLTFVNDLSKELDRRSKAKLIEETQKNMGGGTATKSFHDPSVVPFTPMVQKTMMRESTVKKSAHSDTSFSSGSLRAARRAAGAVQHAVDRVLIGRNRNAFCVVRPPGHHAGINGLLAGGESCGFCIFNNVAAGAMHALSDEDHRPKCERCAIVDLDAHHGNGTEEIVRKCHDPGRLFFFSVHLYDNDKRKGKSNSYKFYPGTGDTDDVAHNIINVPIKPLWREKDLHQSEKIPTETYHNTRNKSKQKAAAAAAAAAASPKDMDESESEKATSSISSMQDGDSVMSNGVTNQSKSATHRQSHPNYSLGSGREAYRRSIQQRLLPALRAFNPDLILVSLGFDASRGDVGNARHYAGGKEAVGIDLEPEDYAWSTRKIMEVADICCQGRIISILEGGYGRTPTISTSNGDRKKENGLLDKSMFSQCAVRHLQALIDPYDTERRYPIAEDKILRKK